MLDIAGSQSGQVIWGVLDDVVMGGVSEGAFFVDPAGDEHGSSTGIFRG